ncbi:hypothetical protein BJ741DRAFT_586214 [Chytriomyces cf. hyalinus JEL632]|nr:hypothetical protein BJ741DRAFT_586214 [Chytriomyces cf. hyalinus JEL632]
MHSDGVPETWPEQRSRILSRSVPGAIVRVAEVGSVGHSLYMNKMSTVLRARGMDDARTLPLNYRIVEKSRSESDVRVDRYLHGHPSMRPYTSPNEFLPHFIYLLDGGNGRCVCKLCNMLSKSQKPQSAPKKLTADSNRSRKRPACIKDSESPSRTPSKKRLTTHRAPPSSLPSTSVGAKAPRSIVGHKNINVLRTAFGIKAPRFSSNTAHHPLNTSCSIPLSDSDSDSNSNSNSDSDTDADTSNENDTSGAFKIGGSKALTAENEASSDLDRPSTPSGLRDSDIDSSSDSDSDTSDSDSEQTGNQQFHGVTQSIIQASSPFFVPHISTSDFAPIAHTPNGIPFSIVNQALENSRHFEPSPFRNTLPPWEENRVSESPFGLNLSMTDSPFGLTEMGWPDLMESMIGGKAPSAITPPQPNIAPASEPVQVPSTSNSSTTQRWVPLRTSLSNASLIQVEGKVPSLDSPDSLESSKSDQSAAKMPFSVEPSSTKYSSTASSTQSSHQSAFRATSNTSSSTNSPHILSPRAPLTPTDSNCSTHNLNFKDPIVPQTPISLSLQRNKATLSKTSIEGTHVAPRFRVNELVWVPCQFFNISNTTSSFITFPGLSNQEPPVQFNSTYFQPATLENPSTIYHWPATIAQIVYNSQHDRHAVPDRLQAIPLRIDMSCPTTVRITSAFTFPATPENTRSSTTKLQPFCRMAADSPSKDISAQSKAQPPSIETTWTNTPSYSIHLLCLPTHCATLCVHETGLLPAHSGPDQLVPAPVSMMLRGISLAQMNCVVEPCFGSLGEFTVVSKERRLRRLSGSSLEEEGECCYGVAMYLRALWSALQSCLPGTSQQVLDGEEGVGVIVRGTVLRVGDVVVAEVEEDISGENIGRRKKRIVKKLLRISGFLEREPDACQDGVKIESEAETHDGNKQIRVQGIECEYSVDGDIVDTVAYFVDDDGLPCEGQDERVTLQVDVQRIVGRLRRKQL